MDKIYYCTNNRNEEYIPLGTENTVSMDLRIYAPNSAKYDTVSIHFVTIGKPKVAQNFFKIGEKIFR